MRGIERLVAAILLAGAVAGAAVFPRFLGGSGTGVAPGPGLGLRTPAPAAVEAAPLPAVAPLAVPQLLRRVRPLVIPRLPAVARPVRQVAPSRPAARPAAPTPHHAAAPRVQAPDPSTSPVPTPAPVAAALVAPAPAQSAPAAAPASVQLATVVQPASASRDQGRGHDNGKVKDPGKDDKLVAAAEQPLAVTIPTATPPAEPAPVVQPETIVPVTDGGKGGDHGKQKDLARTGNGGD